MMKLMPGFRFRPTGVELINYFLKRKVMGKRFQNNLISELDIYKYAPWDLPDKSYLKTGDLEWYFFCPVEKKYGNGVRLNRATEIGYWKSTGKDRAVQHKNQTVGMIKTLIFHTGKAPRGDRTDWVMHEYRLEDKDLADKGIAQNSYVVCKVFQKEGRGPKNGAQYGRPFNEEDWSDDDEVAIPFADSVPNDQNFHGSGYNGSISLSCDQSVNPCQIGLMPSPDDPASHSCPENQAVNSNFFEGLGDLEAEFSMNRMTAMDDAVGSGDLNFVELIDLDSELFWQTTTQPESWS
uniref:NAC family transcription factor n=1 Tax=Melilotus albus TaxID=47082 RepID=A0A896WDP0_MELAB|nr:NAC family transcription factor [Melilotus albus]